MAFVGAILILIGIVFSRGFWGATTTLESDNGYYYEDYTVDVDVQYDNSYDVSEVIVAKFAPAAVAGESHGIYRYIPLNNVVKITVDDVEKDMSYHCKVTDISIRYKINNSSQLLQNYEIEYENNCIVFIIGSEYQLVNNATVTYYIDYKYVVGYDRIEEYDLFYFNILGGGRTTKINNFSYSITMPEEFDTDDFKFYVGVYGETGGENLLSKNITDKTIYGDYIGGGAIEKDVFITSYIRLYNGYFSEVIQPSYIFDYILYGISGLLMLGAIMIAIRGGAKRQIINKPIEFYPPKGYNPPEACFVSNGQIPIKKMSSLIIYWASGGYLKINAGNTQDIILTKLKDLPKTVAAYEQTIFQELFKSGDEVHLNTPNVALGSVLVAGTFAVKDKKGGSVIKPKSMFNYIMIKLMGLIPLLILAVIFIFRNNGEMHTFTAAIGLIILQFFSYSIIANVFERNANLGSNSRKNAIMIYILSTIACGIFILISFYIFDWDILDKYFLRIVVPIVTFVCSICALYVLRIRENLVEEFGRVEGFKDFLEKAEKDRIKLLVDENPGYFYDILPYAYVFDITDKFSKKFEGITIQPSEYYYYNGSDVLVNLIILNVISNNINRSLIKNITKSMTNAGKNAGSGRFGGGGGGFSGGGFGGGGSGRW
jgi:uncharacterized membrane protein YgcG